MKDTSVRAPIKSITDVAERQLCLGCGACAYVQPDVIRMVDDVDQGRRPLVQLLNGRPPDTSEAVAACPGVALEHPPTLPEATIPELREAWGPVLEIWEGYAADPEIRFEGSSGGAATAIALHCLEQEAMHGTLHIRARRDVPYLNETVLSRTRAELLAATGSRYAPASPCDRLDLIEDAPAPCVFIGKPCDVAAVGRARRLRPALDRNLGVTIGIFCAGTPSVRGTFAMMEHMGVDPDEVGSVRYRGRGWPGEAEVRNRNDDGPRRMSYDDSWGKILQKHRQWRCKVCIDHTGEFADIAVGDPWYRDIPEDEPGRSLVVVRTERGRRIVRAAMASGALVLERVAPATLPASQPNLLETRGAVAGRLLTSRLMGAAAPVYRNMPMWPLWWRELTVREKVRSFTATAKRVASHGLRRRRAVVEHHPRSVCEDTT